MPAKLFAALEGATNYRSPQLMRPSRGTRYAINKRTQVEGSGMEKKKMVTLVLLELMGEMVEVREGLRQ